MKKIIISILFICSAFSVYYFLGNAQGLKNKSLLSELDANNPENIDALISGIEKQFAHHGEDPMHLALLGKLYLTRGDYQLASDCFAKAYLDLPDDEEILIDYTSAYYLAHDGKIDETLESLIHKVEQSDETLASLSLLANIAFDQGNPQKAIEYWQKMKVQLPSDSPLYQELSVLIQFAGQ